MARSRLEDVKGKTFGTWLVLEGFSRFGRAYLRCQCSCGAVKEIREDSLLCGDSTMCHACANRIGRNLKHGENRRKAETVEYRAWSAMFHRCSPTYKRPQDYFDRGITVCDEWSGEGGYERFLEHVGRRPAPGYSLDRIDNNRGYAPGNVRWATKVDQQRNRRANTLLTIRGETRCVAEWAEIGAVSADRVHARMRAGWSAEEAVFGAANV